MLFSKNTVNKESVDNIMPKSATPTVFAAIKEGVKPKVSPSLYGGKGEPYFLKFEGGIYSPQNSMELLTLRLRQRTAKDVIELDIESLEKALSVLKAKPKKGAKK